MKLDATVLTGEIVRLEPLDFRHTEELVEAANYDEIWTYLDEPTPNTSEAMNQLVQDALNEQERGIRVPFAVIDLATGRAVGSTSYIDIRPHDRGVEIGWTWLTPSQWGTGANTDAKLLLLRHAFEDQNAGRVAIKTDLRNVRSQRAIERLGATREGTWRNHRILSDGSYRHTVYYSVIDAEWPTVRDALRTSVRT